MDGVTALLQNEFQTEMLVLSIKKLVYLVELLLYQYLHYLRLRYININVQNQNQI